MAAEKWVDGQFIIASTEWAWIDGQIVPFYAAGDVVAALNALGLTLTKKTPTVAISCTAALSGTQDLTLSLKSPALSISGGVVLGEPLALSLGLLPASAGVSCTLSLNPQNLTLTLHGATGGISSTVNVSALSCQLELKPAGVSVSSTIQVAAQALTLALLHAAGGAVVDMTVDIGAALGLDLTVLPPSIQADCKITLDAQTLTLTVNPVSVEQAYPVGTLSLTLTQNAAAAVTRLILEKARLRSFIHPAAMLDSTLNQTVALRSPCNRSMTLVSDMDLEDEPATNF
jgi:hypothetical protein